ncbi:ATP-binding cassette domain-containing protein [Cyanobium sp. HWJ4-Hawea]|uniref:ATP-binding cassette domain-containing protein n=1 Tax=Cyanobium sp. HWJ4-Hawea TaxID=2823713 RepID=UPI0020CEF322|nr:ATP-binding cassette domain-containing protein [Cyanobium sp. HWJ4-Hawea]MCP9810169.1 ATP-binding cassette domain-containing protein [Cyanobium sp. HWJ4-Hawea]
MKALLELDQIVVRGRHRPRLDHISLVLQPGERVALIGPSGAGKSSLLAVANGLLAAQGGRVVWLGEERSKSPHRRRRQQARIGTLWQDLRLIEELSVQQNINAGRLGQWGWPQALLNLLLPIETEACAAILKRLELDPALLCQPVSALSGGQRQRVALGRLLRQDPLLLLADEPLASLDPRLANELLQLLLEQAQAPRCLLMSLHRPDLLHHFDRVVGLRDGQLVVDQSVASLGSHQLDGLYAGASN